MSEDLIDTEEFQQTMDNLVRTWNQATAAINVSYTMGVIFALYRRDPQEAAKKLHEVPSPTLGQLIDFAGWLGSRGGAEASARDQAARAESADQAHRDAKAQVD
jgi:hypothetical protein